MFNKQLKNKTTNWKRGQVRTSFISFMVFQKLLETTTNVLIHVGRTLTLELQEQHETVPPWMGLRNFWPDGLVFEQVAREQDQHAWFNFVQVGFMLESQKDWITWRTQVHGDGDTWGAVGRIWLVGEHIVPVPRESFVDQVNGNPGRLQVEPESFAQWLWTRC